MDDKRKFISQTPLTIDAMTLEKKLLDILACPKCKGDLAYRDTPEEESLTCNKCRLKYAVEEGIPIMLIDEAQKI